MQNPPSATASDEDDNDLRDVFPSLEPNFLNLATNDVCLLSVDDMKVCTRVSSVDWCEWVCAVVVGGWVVGRGEGGRCGGGSLCVGW